MRFLLLSFLVLSACKRDSPGEVPANERDLIPFLEDGEYLDYVAEPEVHDSAGPHFGGVRVFFDDRLVASLEAGSSQHPPGAAAIKELYGGGDKILGWSVMVKLEKGGDGDTWYWWERYKDDTLIDGVGKEPCVGCHQGGTDFVLTSLPE